MNLAVAIFVFPEVKILDFAGPFEVFTTAARVFSQSSEAPPPFTVFTVAGEPAPVGARPV
ncbi:MAG TPA: hypothetical protein VD994_11590 [Prosthecobacter sp.]|nr:hypothetical protein [Prosthecobacter sp.]